MQKKTKSPLPPKKKIKQPRKAKTKCSTIIIENQKCKNNKCKQAHAKKTRTTKQKQTQKKTLFLHHCFICVPVPFFSCTTTFRCVQFFLCQVSFLYRFSFYSVQILRGTVFCTVFCTCFSFVQWVLCKIWAEGREQASIAAVERGEALMLRLKKSDIVKPCGCHFAFAFGQHHILADAKRARAAPMRTEPI